MLKFVLATVTCSPTPQMSGFCRTALLAAILAFCAGSVAAYDAGPSTQLCFAYPWTVLREQHQKSVHCDQRTRLRGGAKELGMQEVTLYTNKMCPFAQKAWVALEEKQVEYEMVEVGLYGSGGKPSWFLDMNPKGQVPVLKHGDEVVVESDDIIKYIDKNLGKPSELKGGDDEVEQWLKLLRTELQPKGKAVVLGYGSKDDFKGVLDQLESRIKGPFLTGDTYSVNSPACLRPHYRNTRGAKRPWRCPALILRAGATRSRTWQWHLFFSAFSRSLPPSGSTHKRTLRSMRTGKWRRSARHFSQPKCDRGGGGGEQVRRSDRRNSGARAHA